MVRAGKLSTEEESLLEIFSDKRISRKMTVLFFALTWSVQINLIFCLVYEWANLLNRILVMKEILLSLFAINVYFIRNDMLVLENKLIMRYIKNMNQHNTSKERDRLITEQSQFMKWFGGVASVRVFKFIFIFGACLPMLQVSIALARAYFTGKLEKVPSVIFVYVPQVFRTIPGYLIIHLLCFTWSSFITVICAVIYKVYLTSMKCVETEMDLLCQSMFEIGPMLANGYELNTKEEQGSEKKELRHLFSVIIQHHQHILRSIKLLSKHLKLMIITLLNVYGLQTCLYIILTLKMEQVGLRIKNASLYMMSMLIIYTCTKTGQELKDKGDKLRMALYNCSWIDKPEWFKRSLLVMMSRAIQATEFRPFGLYSFDMNCMANVLKATYTYFNAANEFLK